MYDVCSEADAMNVDQSHFVSDKYATNMGGVLAPIVHNDVVLPRFPRHRAVYVSASSRLTIETWRVWDGKRWFPASMAVNMEKGGN